ncbi:coiled-coil domain-containing protein 69-like isoform X2 [Nannospalax galili]|uniref:coiled-coil domain-containing protein 69-like isoform X2 n=1 Tax=Nannospalax galili TaxID=1026970 RepID=UPI00081A061A|nr:coiled-coil domain-containing protein 69-like isoform X2 [Nannospalax galili]
MNGVQGSLLSQVYKRHIQDHGSPGLFWEQELESLHHVIELKNERIHELERELLLVDMLKEKNLMLALKNTTLRQEIEDLHFRAGNRATMSRQFWKDVLQVPEKGSQDGPLCSRRRSHLGGANWVLGASNLHLHCPLLHHRGLLLTSPYRDGTWAHHDAWTQLPPKTLEKTVRATLLFSQQGQGGDKMWV